MATYKIEGQTYQFPDDMPDDEVQTALSGILGGTSMQAEEPKQGDFLESFVNAAKLEGLGKNAVVDYMSLVGNYREAKALAEQHARDYPSSGAGQFLGNAVGMLPQSAAALYPPTTLPILAHFAARAGGQARMLVAQQREAGAEIGPLKEAAAVIGYGALTFIAEKLGYTKLGSIVERMSADALAEVGYTAIKGTKKELVKAIGKRLLPAATTMGLWEGTEEAFEQAGTNIIDKMYMDRSIFEGVPQAFGAGTLGGMMLAPAFAVKASFDMKQAMKQKDAAGDDTAFNGSTFEESKGITKERPPKTLFLEDLPLGDRNTLRRFYNKTLRKYYGDKDFDDRTEKGTNRKVKSEHLLTKDEQDAVIAAWEDSMRQEAPPVLTPPGMQFVTESQLPNKKEGQPLSAVKTEEVPRADLSMRIGKEPTQPPIPVEKVRKVRPLSEGELHFQQSDGTTVQIPINAEVRAKQKARLLATGLVNQVLEHEGQIWFKDGKQVPEGTPGAQMALGGVDREGNVHLSNRIAFNTIGHELFELAWTTLERLKNPIIQRGLDLFGGKERLADISGNYWAANPQYDKPNVLRQFGRWVQNLFTEFKNVIGVEISQEEVGRYVNTKIGELAAGKLAPQIMRQEGLAFQSAGAARTQARLDQQEDALKKERSFWKNFWPDVKRKWVDTSSNVRNELLKYGAAGQKAVEKHDLVKGATARAAEIMQGAEKNIFGGLTPFEDKLLARIAQVRREIALYESNPQKYANFAQSAQDGKEWLAELDQGTASKLMPRVDALFAQYREMLDEALAEQLITQEAHDKMAAVGPYLTREHMDYIDPLTYTIRGEKMSVRDSGFYRTRDLDEDVVNNDMRMLLFEYAARLSSRAYKNRANRELLKLAQENPDNPLVRLHQEGTSTVPPKGFAPVSMFVDGKEQLVFMPEDMAVEWIVTDPMIKAQLGRWLGWVSGTTPLKMMATGMNPAFAIANFPRDLAHIFLTTNEYSSSLFVALPQMSADLVATAKDAWNKTGAYHDFVMQGGGMSFLTHQGQRSKTPTDRTGYMMQQLGQLQDFFGFLGEFTETWTRLALRNRALKRALASGMSQEEAESHATWVARNYLDFSQGGSYAKALDTVVPYLNASIQGTRGLVRAAKANPTIFAYKAGQLGMVAGSLALANALVNPDIWDEISEDEKNNYFIITRPELSFTDKEGNQRHMYIRIAKDQGQKLLATIFEAGALAAVGKPVDSERFVKAAAELLPIVPDGTLLPPLVDAIIGYIYNKDFYKNEDIWKGEDLSQRGLEFTSATNPAYIRLAELTPVLAPGSSNLPVLGQELSPERTRYAVEQIFVRGNPFSWLVGTGFREMMKDMPGKDLERTKQEIWSNFPGVNRMVKTTYPGLRYKKDVEQMRKEENTRLLKMRRDLDELVENDMVERSPETRRALREFISKADRSDKARLKEREEWTRRLADQPNRQWWLSVATLNPELRATAFYARWAQEDPETRSQLERQARSIPGVSTVRFRRQLRLLQRSGQRTIEP